MKVATVVMVLCLSSSPLQAAGKWSKAWKWTLGALVATNAADLSTSVGRPETNPFLRGPDGRFSTRRGFAIKSAAIGGLALTEWLLIRKQPELHKPFTVVNGIAAGVVAGVAVQNTVRR